MSSLTPPQFVPTCSKMGVKKNVAKIATVELPETIQNSVHEPVPLGAFGGWAQAVAVAAVAFVPRVVC